MTSVTSSASTITLPAQWIADTGVYTIGVHPTGATSGSATIGLTLENFPARPTGSSLDTANALATNLVGLFLMNEGTGTTDLDLVDSQTASFSGSSLPTWNTTDPSIAFGGGGSLHSYVDAGADLTFDQLPISKMTIVTKVYVTTVAAGGLVEKNDGNNNAGIVFGWTSAGSLRLLVTRSGSDLFAGTASSAIPTGRWVQIAVTWDGTVDNVSALHLYIDGVEQTKTTSSNGTGTLGSANATNKPFRIGNASFDTTGSFNGKMAYLAVYRGRLLTTSEMATLDTRLPIH
jgi:hypothetical protein